MSDPITTTEPAAADAPASPVLLRGTGRGLEIVVDAGADLDAISDALSARLDEAPGFFAGNDACVRCDGRLPSGALALLERITALFDLRIVEVSAGPAAVAPAASDGAPDGLALASGSSPARTEPLVAPVPDLVPLPVADELADELAAAALEILRGPRVVLGPVRSGVVLEGDSHLVVVGDVNPGAEVRSRGNILVLGRLRGVAHAAVGQESGFIMALRLEPQQLRIGRLVARPGDADQAGQNAEIAYATGRTIVVERYQGRLPGGLAASM